MTTGIKAVILLGGLFAFFALAVVGSVVEAAVGDLARDSIIALLDDSPQRVHKTRVYAEQSTDRISVAFACCGACDGRWDFSLDRCEIVSQTLGECVQTCGAKSK